LCRSRCCLLRRRRRCCRRLCHGLLPLLRLGILLLFQLLPLGILLLLQLLLLLDVLLLFQLPLLLDVLLLLLLLLLPGILLLFQLLLLLDVLLLFQLPLLLDILLLLLLLLLDILLLLLLLLLPGILLLFQLLLPLGVLLLFQLLLLLDVLLLLQLLLLLDVPLLFLLLLLPGVLLLLQLLLLLDILLLFQLPLLLDILLLLLLLRRGLRSSADRGLNIGLNTLDSTHIHDAYRSARRRCTLPYLLDVGGRERAAGILDECRLLPLERNRSGRRSRSRHHGAAQHVGGRTRSARGSVGPRAEHTLPLRRNRRSSKDLDRTKLSRRNRTRILRHAPASRESVLRNCRDSILDVAVYVLNIRDRRVVSAGVVVVVDGGIVDHRIGIVHPREIAAARLVGREIRLTRTQGEPSHGRNRADGKAQLKPDPPRPPPPTHATSAGA
jgi:hypothetical protein